MEVDEFEVTADDVEFDLLNDVVEMDDVEMSDDELERELKEIEKENESHQKEEMDQRERKDSTRKNDNHKNDEKRETDRGESTTNRHRSRNKDKIPEIYKETDDDYDRHRRNGHHRNRYDREREYRSDRSDIKGPEIYRERDHSDRIDFKRLNKTLHVTKTSDPTIVGREIAYRLQEPKMTLFGHVVRVLGLTTTHEIFAETKEIVNRGGIKTDNGDRKRSPGGTFLYVMKNRCYATPEQIKEIFKEENDARKKSKKKRVRAQREIVRKEMKQLDEGMKKEKEKEGKEKDKGIENTDRLQTESTTNKTDSCIVKSEKITTESMSNTSNGETSHQAAPEEEELEEGELE